MNGKPRIVSQRYLGSAEEVMARLGEGSSGDSTSSEHRSFGDLAAVWGAMNRLGVINIIDEVVGERRSDTQVSVGAYIALATLNRVVAPCSKLAFSEWWAGTAGDRLVRLSAAEIAHITRPRWVGWVVTWTLSGSGPKDFALSFAVDEEALRQLEDERFGKRILFSDREDWIVADLVGTYRSQHHVESDFRQMKDRQVVSFSPMFHWTDSKIRVHMFYCVLALAIAKLMAREVRQSSMDMSVREMLATLAGIQETVLFYKGDRGRPRARRLLTEMKPTQQRLYDLFDLATYAPKR